MDRSDGVGGGAAGAGVGAGVASGGDAKRARKEKKKINQENVVDTLKRHGGRLSSKVRSVSCRYVCIAASLLDPALISRLVDHVTSQHRV